MQDEIGSTHGARAGRGVEDRAFDQLVLGGQMREIFRPPGRKVVQNDDILATVDQMSYQMRADKAGSAGHEIAHFQRRLNDGYKPVKLPDIARSGNDISS